MRCTGLYIPRTGGLWEELSGKWYMSKTGVLLHELLAKVKTDVQQVSTHIEKLNVGR